MRMKCLVCGSPFIAMKDCTEHSAVLHYWCQVCKTEFEIMALEVFVEMACILTPEFAQEEFERIMAL